MKCSEALRKKETSAFSCSTRLSSSLTLSSPEPGEIRCCQSGSPYLPGVTRIDAAHLCSLGTGRNEVAVLELAQGVAESSPSLQAPSGTHTGSGDLGLALGSLGTPASGPRVCCDQRLRAALLGVIFFQRNIHCEKRERSPLRLSISFDVAFLISAVLLLPVSVLL